MPINTLKERVDLYQDAYNYQIIRKLPVIISLNGRSFVKTTSLLNKPFCSKFSDVMSSIIVKLSYEVDGLIFAYSFSDEIILILRNDQSHETLPWYDNKVQNISSVAASIATLQFRDGAVAQDLPIVGNGIFMATTFAVPNISEAINTLIAKQQQAYQEAVSSACFFELIKTYDLRSVKETLLGRTIEEKLEILTQTCNINFADYPAPFRKGIACYRVPQVIETKEGSIIKNKIAIDNDVPVFTKNPVFLNTIFKSGKDIVRGS